MISDENSTSYTRHKFGEITIPKDNSEDNRMSDYRESKCKPFIRYIISLIGTDRIEKLLKSLCEELMYRYGDSGDIYIDISMKNSTSRYHGIINKDEKQWNRIRKIKKMKQKLKKLFG